MPIQTQRLLLLVWGGDTYAFFNNCCIMSGPLKISLYLLFFLQYQICKRKLDSKCEALHILSKDLDQCRQERDQFKLMAEQVQARYQALKRQLAGVVSHAHLHGTMQ